MEANVNDGYIKYTIDRRDGMVPASVQLDTLNRARSELFHLGLIGVYPDGVGYGNVSIRASGNQFVITASATGSHSALQRDQFSLVESFSVEQNRVQSRGSLSASSESMTHGAIYEANRDVNCVIHIHSRRLFDHLIKQAWLATSADIPYGTPAMARQVARLVAAQPGLPVLFAMAGHAEGIIAYGADVPSTQALLLATYYRIHTP